MCCAVPGMINAIGCPHFYPYFGHFWPKAGTPWGHVQWEKPKAAVGRTAIQKGHIFVCKAKAYGNLPNFSWHSGIGHKKKHHSSLAATCGSTRCCAKFKVAAEMSAVRTWKNPLEQHAMAIESSLIYPLKMVMFHGYVIYFTRG